MTLIEGIGDEVTQFFIALIVVIIVTLAWWTTSISEQRHIRTVLLLDRRRLRNRAYRRLTNHTETVTITAGAPATSSTEPSDEYTEEAAASTSSHKPPEAENANNDSETEDDNEQNRIIESMDADTVLVRQRRLDFYESGEAGASSDSDRTTTEVNEETDGPKEPTIRSEPPKESNITIKLKYINDDLKLVDGRLEERLGDFKKRHFQPELASNKLVRLIFNGQVLQQDMETLQSCGLFDNCVVHCLIHQKRAQSTENSGDASASSHYESVFNDRINSNANNNNNNNQPREWDFGNSLFAFISVILLAAWYFRLYVYAHLYTVTATVGLILITGIFTIVLVGMYFPDNENLPNPRIHIHAERLQTTSTQ